MRSIRALIQWLTDWLRDVMAEPVLMSENPRYSNYRIGKWTYGRPDVRRWRSDQSLTVGAFCSISGDVKIFLGGEHRTDFVSTYPFSEFFGIGEMNSHEWSRGNVEIGNDVWIGYGSLILSGTTIGDGAVVAAGSLVSGSVPAYAIVAGRPARILRYRFDKATIEALLAISWWDWSDDRIKESALALMSPDVAHFVSQQRK